MGDGFDSMKHINMCNKNIRGHFFLNLLMNDTIQEEYFDITMNNKFVIHTFAHDVVMNISF